MWWAMYRYDVKHVTVGGLGSQFTRCIAISVPISERNANTIQYIRNIQIFIGEVQLSKTDQNGHCYYVFYCAVDYCTGYSS